MVKNTRGMNPAQSVARVGRARRQRTNVRGNGIGSDTSTISYRAIGGDVVSDIDGSTAFARYYIPAYTSNQLFPCAGTSICSHYSDAKFNPGTHARWIPTVGFTTPGRVYAAFTTNPEIMTTYGSLATNALRVAFIRSFGNVVSWPIYEDYQLAVPTTLRRKFFDVNVTSPGGTDSFDRSCQILMMTCVIGAPDDATLGAFEFTDNVTLVGLASSSVAT